LVTWARERAGLDAPVLRARFPKLAAWEAGELQPTLRQLEDFARAVHVPIGYLFLPEPPPERLPVPDFRRGAASGVLRPSPDLLDTLYLCQQRQDWFCDYARLHGLAQLDFVGSACIEDDPLRVAEAMREALSLEVEERMQLATWADALRQLMAKAEDAGVLVMASSIVGSNTHRKLDVDEFRGFALADSRAPLVFLNAADSRSAQMFTLGHELAHLWLGNSGVFDVEAGLVPKEGTERWCNAAAAELLVPMRALLTEFRGDSPLLEEIQRLARVFKVSTLVALRRLFEAGQVSEGTLWSTYSEELERLRALEPSLSRGGDFYRTLGTRTGKRFARAVVSSALEGQTLLKDAFRMLGVRKVGTFYEAAREFEVLL